MPVDRPLAPRAATVVCFAAICSAKRGIFRIFLTSVLDTVFFGVVNLRYLGSVGIVGAAFIKTLAGSKKSEESSTCFFQIKCSGTKTKVRLGCRRSPPLPPSPPLLADMSIPFSSEIDPLGIYRLTFLRHARGSCFTVAWGNTRTCDCEARIESSAIPVVKIAPQRPKLEIEDGKNSLSINLCLNASLRRTPVCPCKSGTCIILPAPLVCGLPLGGVGK